jgi:acyl carrier protein
MNEKKFINIISKILNKKILINFNQKLLEIENIDSLDYVKIIIGLKKHGINITIPDIEKLDIKKLCTKKINE